MTASATGATALAHRACVSASRCVRGDMRRHAPCRVSKKSLAAKVCVSRIWSTKVSTCGRTAFIRSRASESLSLRSSYSTPIPGSSASVRQAHRASASSVAYRLLSSALAGLAAERFELVNGEEREPKVRKCSGSHPTSLRQIVTGADYRAPQQARAACPRPAAAARRRASAGRWTAALCRPGRTGSTPR